jgi:PKD repeat protein
VQFLDRSTGPPTSWSWSFGDGGASNEQNPVHTYPGPGTFIVTLDVGNPAGNGTTTGFVTLGG